MLLTPVSGGSVELDEASSAPSTRRFIALEMPVSAAVRWAVQLAGLVVRLSGSSAYGKNYLNI